MYVYVYVYIYIYIYIIYSHNIIMHGSRGVASAPRKLRGNIRARTKVVLVKVVSRIIDDIPESYIIYLHIALISLHK